MGVRNYVIEGVSGTGKTAVCDELIRRGYQAIHGDRELAYQGDPRTGEPMPGLSHEHHLWRVPLVESIVANRDHETTFFCGGCRNLAQFIELFDGIFVLDVDRGTLLRRLAARPDGEWGSRQSERDLILRLHQSGEDQPPRGIIVDATQSLTRVVDEILRRVTGR